ncbi:unnamed protein product [Anisakis simplex]|uniref:Transcriptional regulator n=1 Tax=Anisakis simplex TaxID=6269 RepID=A0A0M3JPH2_ANISI|nr:unnamed protein product [Anisakis simplex]
MNVLNGIIGDLRQLDTELDHQYRTIANAVLLSSHLKLLAIVTAGNDFQLQSYHGFQHLLHQSTFRSALNQVCALDGFSVVNTIASSRYY